MKTIAVGQSDTVQDCAVTLRNRAHLSANQNLLFWYRELYRDQFKGFPDPAALSVVEVGSGTSPLKQFLPNVVTSDVLDLDDLDLVFDCHEIDKFDGLRDENYDVANCSVRFFSALSYMATGGISHKVPIPTWLYRAFFPMDVFLSRCFPRLYASFFTIILSRR